MQDFLPYSKRQSLARKLRDAGYEDSVKYISEPMTPEVMGEFIRFLSDDVLDYEYWVNFCPFLEQRMEKEAEFYFQRVAHYMS